MSTPNEKLAASLERLRNLQADGARVFASGQLPRIARERLVRHGFLQEVMKGWLISASPTARPGDTTPWFSAFWEFCTRYCEDRFGDAWHLSPEQSFLLHAAHTAIPRQVIVYSPVANNNRIDLLFDTSLFAVRERELPQPGDLDRKDGVRVFRLEATLTRVSESFFLEHPIEAQVVLGSVRDPSELLTRLLAGRHTVIAGRLAGAFRRLGRGAIADEIVHTMRIAEHDVRETDPFERGSIAVPFSSTSSIIARLHTLWASARDVVIAELPDAPGLPKERDAYLDEIDSIYELDAYHSLSIEGYEVTPALIHRVASGRWNPDREPGDRDTSHALAARGYWLAFQRVRDTVRRVLADGDVRILRTTHRDWYRELFRSHVTAGLMEASALAGYRNHPVYLRGSRHVPPRAEVAREAMPALFDLIEREPAPAVRAVLGHWLFGYVHPFPDGNGRIARFVMNVLLASGGYPWTVIRVDDRNKYLAALEAASVANDLRPFAKLVAHQMRSNAPVAHKASRSRASRASRRPRR
jgi:fido (protein-threonine AMPylation protein)